MLKKLVIGLGVAFLSLQGLAGWGFGLADVANFPFGDGSPGTNEDSVDFGQIVKDVAVDPEDSASEQIQEELGVAYDQANDQRATYYIKELINRALAIAGLVSLVVLIYGFYKMFVAKDNAEAFKEAMKIVKGAAIALVVIGVSRYIVSIMFDIFFEAKKDIN